MRSADYGSQRGGLTPARSDVFRCVWDGYDGIMVPKRRDRRVEPSGRQEKHEHDVTCLSVLDERAIGAGSSRAGDEL
jgi:hypothetical protein